MMVDGCETGCDLRSEMFHRGKTHDEEVKGVTNRKARANHAS